MSNFIVAPHLRKLILWVKLTGSGHTKSDWFAQYLSRLDISHSMQ